MEVHGDGGFCKTIFKGVGGGTGALDKISSLEDVWHNMDIYSCKWTFVQFFSSFLTQLYMVKRVHCINKAIVNVFFSCMLCSVLSIVK